jgi:tetratricopeptide (TPR) repeat protein
MAPISNKRLYVTKVGRKSRSDGSGFWIVVLLLVGAFSVGWWLWSCLYNVTPRFNFILMAKNGQPMRLLNGEILNIHPKDELRIEKVSTNICFNQGVRLAAGGFDVNALLYDGMVLSKLLPDRDVFKQYKFRIEVKRDNEHMAHVDILVEPHLADWLEKVEQTPDRSLRVTILEKITKMYPAETRIRDRLIEEYKSLERWPQAARLLEELAAKEPNREVLPDLLAVYEAMAQQDGVISVLERLAKQHPDDLAVRLRLASTLQEAGRLPEAIAIYDGLLKGASSEDRLAIFKILGYLHTETNQPEQAIASYLQAIALDQSDVNLYYNLSILYEKIGRKDEADSFLAKAVDLKSDDVDGRLKLAERLINKGETKEAEKHLAEVLRQRPESMEALLLMITTLEKRGDKKTLKKIYRKILLLDPDNETVIYNLAVLEYETGDLAESLSRFQRYAKSHPKDAEVRSFLFDIYRRQKQETLAFKEAQILLKLKPDNAGIYGYLFDYLNARGDYKTMIEIMKGGLKAHPQNTELQEYLVLAYLKTGQEDLAAKQMRAVLKSRPEDLTLLLQLARLDEKRGNLKAALATYQKIIEISPGHEEAEEAYLRLRLEALPIEGHNE